MGLDMWLNREIYIGACHAHNDITGTISIQRCGEDIPVDLNKVVSIQERVCVWRKANQIHNWFVVNVGGGIDDGRQIHVTYDDLRKMYETCMEVLASPQKAGDLLPTTDGFFFGPTDYGDEYMDDLRYTVDTLKPIIENEEAEGWDFIYLASW